MFTGLIEEVGVSTRVGESALRIFCSLVLSDLKRGDSIAVDGVCLTVVELDETGFTVVLSPETIKRTLFFARIEAGSGRCRVNLERALLAGQRLGGHMVQGHVDGMAGLVRRTEQGDCAELTFACETSAEPLIVPKGSITLNGISLTIAQKMLPEKASTRGEMASLPEKRQGQNCEFSVALIPETLKRTNITDLQPGDMVHLETDLFGRYVRQMVAPYLEGLPHRT